MRGPFTSLSKRIEASVNHHLSKNGVDIRSRSRVVPGVPMHHPKTKSPGNTNRAPKQKVS